MDTRTQHILPEVGYSWESTLSNLRDQFATRLRSSSLFDTHVLDAFNKSRQTDGTYAIQPNDPILINNTKSFINILHSLEQLTPGLKASVNFILSDGYLSFWSNASYLAFRAYMDKEKITQFINDIYSLIFFLRQLMATLKSLPEIDATFLPLINQLKDALSNNIQPIINFLKTESVATETNLPNEQIGGVAADLQVMIDEFEQNMVPHIQKSQVDFKKLYHVIDMLRAKAQELITANYPVEPDEVTGLYPESQNLDHNTRNLIRAANMLANIKMAVRKIDFNKTHMFEALRDIGHAIKQLQAINFREIERLGAQGLEAILKVAMEEIEPLFVELVNFAEVAEIRLDLKDEALQAQLQVACESYSQLAARLGIHLKHTFPYREERLFIREQELKRKQHELAELKEAEHTLQNADVYADTPLRELVKLRESAKKIISLEAEQYVSEINELIIERTGGNDLAAEIAKREEAVRFARGQGEKEQAAIESLNEFYQIRHTLDLKIKAVANNPHADDEFSYDKYTKTIVTTKAPIKHQLAAETQAKALASAKTAVTSKQLECERLHRLVADFQQQIIVLNAPEVVDQRDELERLTAFIAKIAAFAPESLYKMPLPALRQLIQEVEQVQPREATQAYLDLLSAALEERADTQHLLERETILNKELAAHSAFLTELLNDLEELNPDIEELDSYENNEKAMNALRAYRKSIESHPYRKMNDKMLNNLADRLQISPAEVLELQFANQKYLTGAWIFQNPLLEKIDVRMRELKLNNEELVPLLQEKKELEANIKIAREKQDRLQKKLDDLYHEVQAFKIAARTDLDLHQVTEQKYSGRLLATWDLASYSVLQVLREQTLDLIPRQKSVATISVEPTMPTETVFSPEPPKVLQERLENEKKSSMQVMIESVRKKIHGINAEYINPLELDTFQIDQKIQGIEITDPLLIKHSKSLLNMLVRCEEIMRQVENIKRKIANQTYVLLPLDIERLRDAAQPLILELQDYAFYTQELHAVLVNLPDQSQLDAFNDLTATINPMLTTLKSWVSLPGMSETTLASLTTSLDNAVVNLQAAAQPTNVFISTTDILNVGKSKLDAYLIDKIGLKRKANGLFSPKAAGANRDLKNIIAIANMTTHIKTLSNKLVSYAESDITRVKHLGSIGDNIFSLYRLSATIDTTRIPEVKIALKEAFESAHLSLIAAVANIEEAELRLGVKPGSFTQYIAQFCQDFEKMAEEYGANLTADFPYGIKKLEVLQEQIGIQEKILAEIKAFQEKMQDEENSFRSESLASLLAMRHTLSHFSPSKVAPLLNGVNQLIAERTGLTKIQAKISAIKSELIEFEKTLTSKNNDLAIAQTHIREAKEQQEKMLRIEARFAANDSLSMEEIKFLHSVYSQHTNINLEEFCNLLIYQRETVQKWLAAQLVGISERLSSQQAQEASAQLILAERQKLYTEKQQELEKYRNLEAQLQEKMAAISLNDTTEIKFNPKTEEWVADYFVPPSRMPRDKQTMEHLQSSIAKLESKKTKLKSAHQLAESAYEGEVIKALIGHKNRLISLESKLGYSTGSLSHLVTGNANDLLHASQEVHSLNHLRGLFTKIAQQNTAAKNKYAAILSAPLSPSELARAVKRQARKETTLVGRWVRWIIGKPSVDDKMFAVANYASNEERYGLLFGKNAESIVKEQVQQSLPIPVPESAPVNTPTSLHQVLDQHAEHGHSSAFNIAIGLSSHHTLEEARNLLTLPAAIETELVQTKSEDELSEKLKTIEQQLMEQVSALNAEADDDEDMPAVSLVS